MDGYAVWDVSFTSKEPGIPVADVEFCLAGGTLGTEFCVPHQGSTDVSLNG